jgi:hypothetical protein
MFGISPARALKADIRKESSAPKYPRDPDVVPSRDEQGDRSTAGCIRRQAPETAGTQQSAPFDGTQQSAPFDGAHCVGICFRAGGTAGNTGSKTTRSFACCDLGLRHALLFTITWLCLRIFFRAHSEVLYLWTIVRVERELSCVRLPGCDSAICEALSVQALRLLWFTAVLPSMFWVQRGEEVCRKRCADIQAALSGEGSFNKKYRAVFALIDSYTDEDSNVDLLNGKTLSTSGPVWVDDPTQIGQPNDVTVREEVQKHAISNSSPGSSGPQPQPSTASQDIGPAEKTSHGMRES